MGFKPIAINEIQIMRRLITSNFVSLDGYLAGPGGDLSWHNVNDEFLSYAESMLEAAGTLVFGRKTYELMVSYWTQEHVKVDDPIIARYMNTLDKVVFSTTMTKADWEHTTLFSEDVEKNIARLKEQPGKDIVILGSGTIVSALTQADMIDEHRIFINPVVLGAGTPQFTGHIDPKKMELTGLRKFETGLVMLSYQPIK